MSRPRLAFVGVGWIGAMRMESVAASGAAEVVAVCDPVEERLESARAAHGAVAAFTDHADLLEAAGRLALDGVVIATPNALHAEQTITALERGLAVFCQKPLAIDAAEARSIVDAARRADRLLGVDYSYRYTDGARSLKALADSGAFGRVAVVEAVFHNAYGPGKAWCYDPALAGGGALVDLGVHLIDLVLWILGETEVITVHGRALRRGEPVGRGAIDDFAIAHLELEGGTVVHLAVSWEAHAGRDCVIRAAIHGTDGGAEFRNVNGSFLDFETERYRGRTAERVAMESGAWLGRGILDWVERLAVSRAFDPEIEGSVRVAEVIDAIYDASPVLERRADPVEAGASSPAHLPG